VIGACTLHNSLRKKCPSAYCRDWVTTMMMMMMKKQVK
jgi:hypothetical protein